ncbi:MAG: Cys-tRNA(Pro) deacylase [Acidimicrobiia bacterium]|nr:Cys-tRNA(Pro) deacylase [Acidimicrobiia bacterium]MDH5616929.1 Cys-tRNA(Pro) deacylase [Acidimicrobiia bacterium]
MTKGGTRAIDYLREKGIDFTVHEYQVGEFDTSYGEAVAAGLDVPPERLFKTLVARVDERPVVGMVPVSGRLSLKNLARAAGGKRAVMAEAADAERLTGYVVGGISPVGQTRRLPTVIDAGALEHSSIFVSGGRRGLQLELAASDLIRLTGADVAEIAG